MKAKEIAKYLDYAPEDEEYTLITKKQYDVMVSIINEYQEIIKLYQSLQRKKKLKFLETKLKEIKGE